MKYEDEIKTIGKVLWEKLKSDTEYYVMAVSIQYPYKTKEEIRMGIVKAIEKD